MTEPESDSLALKKNWKFMITQSLDLQIVIFICTVKFLLLKICACAFSARGVVSVEWRLILNKIYLKLLISFSLKQTSSNFHVK